MDAERYGAPVRFLGTVANRHRDGSIAIEPSPPGPPKRIDGVAIGFVPLFEGSSPHGGEVHPDGDELLYVVSGLLDVVLDDGGEESRGVEVTIRVGPGDAYVVPRGVWHRLVAVEPCCLVHATPGPGGAERPLGKSTA